MVLGSDLPLESEDNMNKTITMGLNKEVITEDMMNKAIEGAITAIAYHMQTKNTKMLKQAEGRLVRLYRADMLTYPIVNILDKPGLMDAIEWSNKDRADVIGLSEIVSHCKARAMMAINLTEYAIGCRENGEDDNHKKLINLAMAIEKNDVTDEQLNEAIWECTL